MIRNRALKILTVTIAAIPLLYGTAGMIGGAIPVNANWREPADGIRIYVEDNGIHTGLVLPVQAAGVDLRDLASPGDLRDPRYGAHRWRSFGWGDRDFYIGTPTWSDVNPLTVLKAATGQGATAMHVDFVPEPRLGSDVRTIVLRPDEYRRLTAFVRASFAGKGSVPGYADYDAFYPATGGYSAIRTCNAWTGEALKAAGMRMGAWTPFPVTVMAWLPTE
jgi:uncharacterized protein (TIGR02117 family)